MDPFRSPAVPTWPCPRCAIGLGTRHVLDVRLDECSACTGVFVPREVVPRLLDPLDLGLEVVHTFDPGEPEFEPAIRYLRCPRCATMMNRRMLVKGSNVIVDHCNAHGIWFDAFELRRLAELGSQHDVKLNLDRDREPPLVREADREAAVRREHAAALARPIEGRSRLLTAVVEILTGLFR